MRARAAAADPVDARARVYSRDEVEEVGCPMCASADSAPVAREFGLVIARCRACGLVYTRTPRRNSQGHYAVPESMMREKYGDILAGRAEHPRTANYHEHLSLLESLTEGRDLLDIGAHCGFFLRVARERGWRGVGVEPSDTTAALARTEYGLDVRSGGVEDVDLPRASFDVVTLVDVLEHIGNPRTVLGHAARVLRPGGRVFIKVPNVRYVMAKHRTLGRVGLTVGDSFDAREHLVHYSHLTLRKMLQSQGFEIERMRVPLPIQSGSRLRQLARGAGPAFARRLPRGHALPVATDLVAVGRT